MRLCFIIVDQRGTGQETFGVRQVGQSQFGLLTFKIKFGTVEIDLAKFGIEADGFVIQCNDVRFGILKPAGSCQPQIGRAKIRIDAQGLIVGFERVAEIPFEAIGLPDVIVRISRIRLVAGDLLHPRDDPIPVLVLVGGLHHPVIVHGLRLSRRVDV